MRAGWSVAAMFRACPGLPVVMSVVPLTTTGTAGLALIRVLEARTTARSVEIKRQLPERRVPVFPGAGLLELGGQGDQGALVAHPPGQHHAEIGRAHV